MFGWLRDLFSPANTTESGGSDATSTIGFELHALSNTDGGQQNTRLTVAASFNLQDGHAGANFKFALSSDNGAVPADGTITFTTSLNGDLVNATFELKADLDHGIAPIEANSIAAEHSTSHSAEPGPSQLLHQGDAHGSWEFGIVNLNGNSDYPLV